MTPDGISTAEWARVHEFAAEIVNASADDDEALGSSLVAQLLQELDRLELHYGRLASLLATRADYLDEGPALELLEEAYAIAQSGGDHAVCLLVADSLASRHIEDRRDRVQGAQWLAACAHALRSTGSASDIKQFEWLEGQLQLLP
ncbi:MAG: hypothetical protein ABIT71_14110 [Vicinamibacteraceae bacterium]